MKAKVASGLVLAAAFYLAPAHAQNLPGNDKTVATKEVMGAMYEALQAVLPYSLSREKFEDPKAQALLRTNLQTLATRASMLPAHTEFHDPTFKYLGTSLARDAKDAFSRFEKGSTVEALYLLNSLTDNCVACHARLPSADSLRAEGLFKNIDLEKIPLDEKARLYLVTRQFDKSMQAYKEVVLSSHYSTEKICLSDWIGDYLMIAIRVKKDFSDAQETLAKFLQRKDLPLYARHDAKIWQQATEQLAPRAKTPATLTNIRKLMDEARAQTEFPLDRQGLIHYLLASSLLYEYVMTNPKGEEASEAYYLLGLTESLTGRSRWLSQNEFYLETAIRSAPRSRFAEKAYRKLEETVLFEYSGSSGVNVPEDVEAHLSELRKLLAPPRSGKVKS